MMNLVTGNPDAGHMTTNKGEVYVDGKTADGSIGIDDDPGSRAIRTLG